MKLYVHVQNNTRESVKQLCCKSQNPETAPVPAARRMTVGILLSDRKEYALTMHHGGVSDAVC